MHSETNDEIGRENQEGIQKYSPISSGDELSISVERVISPVLKAS